MGQSGSGYGLNLLGSGSECWFGPQPLRFSSISRLMCLGEKVMAHAPGSLLALWETQSEFQNSGFSLVPFWMFWVWTGSWRCDCNWWSYEMPVLLVAAHHAIPQIPNEFLKIIKMCLYLPLRAEFIHDFYSIFSWIKLTEKCKLTSIYSKIKILIIWLMTLFLKNLRIF